MFDTAEAVRKLALGIARWSGAAPLAERLDGNLGGILMLHRVTAAPPTPLGLNAHLAVTPDFLDASLASIRRLGYGFVSMDEAVERLRDQRSGEKFVAITADDGYRDNLSEALPVFEKHAAPFTVFVAPGLVDGVAHLWWEFIEDAVTMRDRLEIPCKDGTIVLDCSTPAEKRASNRRLHAILCEELAEEEQTGFLRHLAAANGLDADRPRRDLLMTWDEIRNLAAHPLATVGAHTVHHYNLKRLSPDAALWEMSESARIIEERLGSRPAHFAYPYGFSAAAGARETELAKEAGFVSAVTTRHGTLRTGHAGHLHALPRISMNGRYQNVAHVRTMLSGITTPLANAGKRLVTV